MKRSIIICYRNRKPHLDKLLPRLEELFPDRTETEIIVVEQNNDQKFLRGQLFNVGAQQSKGDILIFHDVDHWPVNVHYDPPEGVDCWLPIHSVTYVDMHLSPLPLEEVPSGYRHFKDGVDANFFGGVIVYTREAFFKINGFNPNYIGWGFEDADLRERTMHYGLKVQRADNKEYDGLWLALQHPDSNPGSEDSDFVNNMAMSQDWARFISEGLTTQIQHMEEESVNGIRWIKASGFLSADPKLHKFLTIQGMTDFYTDTAEYHTETWNTFKRLVNSNPMLKSHRDWVVNNRFGFGNRALHWIWYLLVQEAPQNFKFLEIGVHMGQVISLVSLLNRAFKKNGSIYGITPLSGLGDKFQSFQQVDYERAIQTIYGVFKLDASDLTIIQGDSRNTNVIEAAEQIGELDLLLIDGGHEYDTVKNDILNYGKKLVKVGGIIVTDDSNNGSQIPAGLIRMDWRGIPDVTKAVNEHLANDENFKELFAVGHNRIFRRLK